MCSIGTCFKFLALMSIFTFIWFLLVFITCHTAPYPKIKVISASINSLTVNNTKLTTNWNISLSVTNHAFFEIIYFEDVSVDVFYMDSYLVLNTSTLPSFTTDIMSVIHMNSSVNGFVDSGAANGIDRSLHQYGMVTFGLDVSASIKFINLVLNSGWKNLNVVCYPLRFAICSNANNTTSGILLESLTCSKSK
jgi:hypothetical protein